MNEFAYGDVTVHFSHVSGTVLSSRKHSETHVTSSGGGGRVGRNGGYVEAPKVRSTVVTRHEFWIRRTDGTEQVFQFTNCNIPLREGQQISILVASNAGTKQSWYAELLNHDARSRTTISPIPELSKYLRLADFTVQSYAKMALLLFGAYLSIHFASGLLGLATCAAAMYCVVRHTSRECAAHKALTTHLAQFAENMFASRSAIFQ